MLDFLVIGSFLVPIPFKSFLNAISVYPTIFLQWSLILQGYNPDGTKLPGIGGFGVRGQAVKTDALQGQSSLRTFRVRGQILNLALACKITRNDPGWRPYRLPPQSCLTKGH